MMPFNYFVAVNDQHSWKTVVKQNSDLKEKVDELKKDVDGLKEKVDDVMNILINFKKENDELPRMPCSSGGVSSAKGAGAAATNELLPSSQDAPIPPLPSNVANMNMTESQVRPNIITYKIFLLLAILLLS